jgi:hypothetical protein
MPLLLARLFVGYNKVLRVFDAHCPGRDYAEYSLNRGEDGVKAGVYLVCCSDKLMAV